MSTLDAHRRVHFAVAHRDDGRSRLLLVNLLRICLLRWKHPDMERLPEVLDSLIDAAHRVVAAILGHFEMRTALQTTCRSMLIARTLRVLESQVRVVLVPGARALLLDRMILADWRNSIP